MFGLLRATIARTSLFKSPLGHASLFRREARPSRPVEQVNQPASLEILKPRSRSAFRSFSGHSPPAKAVLLPVLDELFRAFSVIQSIRLSSS